MDGDGDTVYGDGLVMGIESWGWGSQGCGPYHVPVQLSITDLELLNFFFHTFLLEC